MLKEIHARLRRADIVYFGDLKNAPYGEKTAEELGVLTVLGIKKLVDEGATQIVSACNSASANIVVPLFKDLKIKPEDIIEMVGPTTRAFRDKKRFRVLLVATEATIRSGIYQNAFRPLDIELQTLPLIHLARAIEEKTSEPAILAMVGDALEKYNGSYDTLVLACTHFPLVIDIFCRCVPKSVKIFDPAGVVADEVVNKYEKLGQNILSNSRAAPAVAFGRRREL
ncbi:MAG: aspartate/glutamate racemase family protein, partial [bacterium]|nr:aspartate/glutamate racemase family protein [bacterium]